MKEDKFKELENRMIELDNHLYLNLFVIGFLIIFCFFLTLYAIKDKPIEYKHKLVLSEEQIRSFCIENNYTNGYITNYDWEGNKLTCYKKVDDINIYKEWKE